MTTRSDLVAAARELAGELLGFDSERWRHTAGVAERAAELAPAVPADDLELLVAGAWLHDIGYASTLRVTGFHPLDGADGLRDRGWEPRLCALVAHHSGARFVAEDRGLGEELHRYAEERSALADALTYADQTVGPDGRRMAFEDRIVDMLRRHGPNSPNARVHPRRGPYLAAIAGRVRTRLAVDGAPPTGEVPS
ncbi:HD domain-containing protein [Cryptosporangium minutisporangium]|uniref:HD domain-containing protein n=1 Tax=Cryptosporangium minutisporangium TaxID=113569 RepID=UPI0031E6F35E